MRHDMELCDQSGEDQDKACLDGHVVSALFMVIDDKGGDEMRVRSWTWIKRSNIEEDQYSWTRGAHK